LKQPGVKDVLTCVAICSFRSSRGRSKPRYKKRKPGINPDAPMPLKSA
jgi:hypothetical protein